MEIKNNSQFDFLFNLLSVLEGAQDESDIKNISLKCIQDYSKDNAINVSDIKIFVFDKASNSLKDYVKPWQDVSSDIEFENINFEYLFFKNNQKIDLVNLPKLIINGAKILSASNLLDFNKEFKKHLKEENILSFPLKNKDKISGVIRIYFSANKDTIKLEKHYLQLLYLASSHISNAVKTLEEIKKMDTNIRFYKTMKDVAKIIETQYDLNYILPILGEMIDKFISEHLIYIFLKPQRKNEYNLVWPSKCTDKRIFNILSEMAPVSTLIEDGGKIGVFPLIHEEKTIGAIVACNHFEPLKQSEIEYLEQLTCQASLTIDRAETYSKMLKYATLDALTGLNNRHQFAHRLKQEVATSRRNNSPLCCIMLDIDFFKSVNDNYGHAVGDRALSFVSKIIKKEIREYDIASRYGGEEFTIITPNTTIDEAYLVAQRLRSAVESKKINIEDFKIEDKKQLSVTISVGVAQYDKKNPDPNSLYQNADKALYEAKEMGRNRVIVYKN